MDFSAFETTFVRAAGSLRAGTIYVPGVAGLHVLLSADHHSISTDQIGASYSVNEWTEDH